MATQVAGTGSVSTTSTKTYISGTNINTSALVEAAYNARLADATRIEDKVTKNNKRIDALTQLQTLSKTVQTSLKDLRQTYSILDNGSVFKEKAGILTTASNLNPANVVSVAIDTGAEKGNYQIESLRLAQVNKIRSDSSYTNTSSDLNLAGTFSVGLAGGTSANITTTADMSLSEVASAINALSATTNVKASVTQVSQGQYALVLSGTQNNKAVTVSAVSGDDVLQSMGVTDSGAAVKNQIQVGQSAQIRIDGMILERDSNNFDDVIVGVKLNLLTAAPGSVINLAIDDDKTQVKDKITAFADSYNALRDFILTNQQVSSGGTVSDDAILFGDTQLKTLSSTVQGLLAKSFGSGAVNSLRQLGITQDNTGKLVTDTVKLDTAIANNYDDVRALFETQTNSPIDTFRLIKNTSAVDAASINFQITYAGGAITNVTANGDANLFDVSGGTITGKAGTQYEGLIFAYVGTQSETFTYTLNQGLADLLDNALTKFSDTVTGSLATEIDNLQSQNTDQTSRADRIKERAGDYRDRLIEKYAAMEAKVNQAQSVIAQLRAILGTNDN